ncbi:MAG: hypothetical protein KDD15_31020 [Lewinella sp.]|nr:hypothetical protein [Lewinella sp.]
MKNPFPTYKGFGLRVAYAGKALRNYGLNPQKTKVAQCIRSKSFENCFEEFDGDAVVYALMAKVYEQNDHFLKNGIMLLGDALWEDWNRHYWDVKDRQLSFF